MHRSGTSLVANLCRELGVWLGRDEQLLQPAPDNPRGYFEHRELMEINVKLLKVLDRSSDNPRLPCPDDWTYYPEIQALSAVAREIVERDLAVKPLWGFKDPRLCLTLPFWLALVPAPRLVVAFRHPLEVAYSLAKRGFTLQWGLHLWAAYHWALAFSINGGQEVFVVEYRRLLSDTDKALRALGLFLGAETGSSLEKAAATVTPELYRNRETDLSWPPHCSSWPLSLALGLLRWAARSHGIWGLKLLQPVLANWALHPPPGMRRLQERST